MAERKGNEASRLLLEYAIDVNELGYSKAKEVYSESNFVTDVKYDCMGRFYEVDVVFVKK